MEQMQLDLFSIRQPRNSDVDPVQSCIDWLTGTWQCSADVIPIVKRLFSEFGRLEAHDRASVLHCLDGKARADGWSLDDAEYLGTFDHGITDYHVLWDRNWAIRMLVPRELVPKVWSCSYGNLPAFYDRDGKLLFTSVFSDGGHVLTREERKAALAERYGGDP